MTVEQEAASSDSLDAKLLVGGREVYERMWSSIAGAKTRVRLEMYIWKSGAIADRFLQEFHAAIRRGVRIELLLDAFGSDELPANYFSALQTTGARVTWFNRGRWFRNNFRNHRKLMIVDEAVAIIGGLNVADEYDGDGVRQGWRDFAVELRGPIVAALNTSLDHMFELADFGPISLRRFARYIRQRRWRKAGRREPMTADLLLGGPGTRSVRFQQVLRADLAAAKDVCVYAAYLIPTRRMRRALRAVARRGRVRLITAANSDVAVVRWAAQHLYSFWLRGGVALYEYQPQILHAKLIVVDDLIYAGSANLDIRSLRINYELMVRIRSASLASRVREVFEKDVGRSAPVNLQQWRNTRRWWQSLRSMASYTLLVRLDPYLVWRGLKRGS